MKSYWLILSGVCVAGCMASNGLQYEAVSETNIYHIAKIRKGMSERQVLHIMHKPYSYESFQVNDDIYDVWFYVTRVTVLDQTRMVPQNLTPLTFKNGVLVGTGYYWYYYAMKEQANEVAAQNPVEKRKTQDQEDTEFENALKTYPAKPAAPAPTPPMPAQTSMAPPLNTVPQIPLCDEKSLSRLCTGMTERQVFSVMGEPLNHKTFEYAGDVYDVWFYETVPSKTGKQSIVPQNVTPLTFKNAFLVSMSDDYYYELKHLIERTNELMSPPVEQPPKQPVTEVTTNKPAPQTPPPAQKAPAPEAAKTPQPSLKNPVSWFKAWKPLFGAKKQDISKIKMGTSQTQIIDQLGSPCKQESYEMCDEVYEVWFYENTPLTFRNGILVGNTDEYYQDIKEKAAATKIDCYDKPAERMQEQESDQNFDYW